MHALIRNGEVVSVGPLPGWLWSLSPTGFLGEAIDIGRLGYPGQTYVPVVDPAFDRATQRLGDYVQDGDIITRQVIDLTAEERYQRELAAVHAARRAAYGTWEQQLDRMYHGTWHDHVAAVKAAYPLPVPP